MIICIGMRGMVYAQNLNGDMLYLNHFPPDTWEDVETDLKRISDPDFKGSEDGNIHNAECGGWDWDISAVNKIARVSGLPGRDADAFAQIDLGMGSREEVGGLLNDGFIFPDTSHVWGWTSDCKPGYPWYYKNNTPCKNTRECADFYGRLNRWQKPIWTCVNHNSLLPSVKNVWGKCRERKQNDNGSMHEPDRPDSLSSCDEVRFQGWYYCCTSGRVTQLKYEDCNENNKWPCLDHPDYGMGIIEWKVFIPLNPITGVGTWITWYFARDKTRNALRCEGDGAKGDGDNLIDFNGERLERSGDRVETGCRVGRGPGEINNPDPDFIVDPGRPVQVWIPQPDYAETAPQLKEIVPRQFVSFFRRYNNASYERDDLSQYVPRDQASMSGIPFNCFGLYYEFDPKLITTVSEDYRCIVDMTNHRRDFERLKDTQKGTGNFGEELNYPDPPFWDAPIPPEPSHTEFPPTGPRPFIFGARSLWGNDFLNVVADGSNTVDSKEGRYEKGFLELETMEMRPTVQMTEDEPRSTGSLMRAFDDTVADVNPERSFVELWQEIGTKEQVLFTPPKIRMALPTAWSIGLDPLDPLFSPKPLEELTANWKEDPLMQSIEIQLEVRDDLLGDIAQYILNTVIPQVEQETMNIVVPLASPPELRSIKEGWCHWYKYQNKKGDCDQVNNGELQELLDKLEEYAVRIDEYRKLRAELSEYLSKYLNFRQDVLGNVADWYKENLEFFREFETSKQQLLALQAKWQEYQRIYREYDEITNMPWCMNTRFTTPIYSLLDPWAECRCRGETEDRPGCLPDPPDCSDGIDNDEDGPIDGADIDCDNPPPYHARRMRYWDPWCIETTKAELLEAAGGTDIPDMVLDLSHLSVSTGVLKIPVLEPVQVQYDLALLRPPSPQTKDPTIPSLPELPPIPSIVEGMDENIVNFEVSDPPEVGVPILDDLFAVEEVIDSLDVEDKLAEMRESHRKFWDSVQKNLGDNDCNRFNEGRCMHVEMDLKERLTRIGSRPAIQLKEDIQSHGKFRESAGSLGDCPKSDWVCQVLRSEYTYPKRGWHIEIEGDTNKQLEPIRTKILQDTIQTMNIPMKSLPIEILPSLDFPPAIPLYE